MKKVIPFVLATALVVLATATASPPASAQVYGIYCCDGYGVRRCQINPSPVGGGCVCYGQGAGWVCL